MDENDGMDQDVELRLASSEVVYSVQKMGDVLRHGTDAEKAFILEEIQQLLGHCMDDILNVLLPIICRMLCMWKVDIQLTAAAAAIQAIKTSHKNLDEEERAFFYQAWAGILVDVIPKLSKNESDFNIFLKLIDSHIGSQIVDSRKLAARVIGALAETNEAKVQEYLLPRVLKLAGDSDVTVRGTAAESMAFVGGALPEEALFNTIWPLLLGFLNEKDVRIRATALRTISRVVGAQREKDNGDKGLFKLALPEILMQQIKFAQEASDKDQRLVNDEEYTSLDVCSDVFGELLYSVSLFYQKGFRKEALKAYVGMATCNGPIIRRNTAFNMPGVALSLGDKFGGELSAVAEYLAKDKDAEVRWILSSGIHETLRILAVSGKVEKLTRAASMLIMDKNPAVCMNALEHYSEMIICFSEHNLTDAVRQICELLTNLNGLIEGSWRLQEIVASQISTCITAIPSTVLMNTVLPVLYSMLEQGMPLVQNAAIIAIVKSFRHFDDVARRDDAIHKFWVPCTDSSRPFKVRIALINGAVVASEVFSSNAFQKLFARSALNLYKDDISNVRLKLASSLPQLHLACGTMAEFESALSMLTNDADPDVRAVMAGYEEACAACLQADWNRADKQKEKAEESHYSKMKGMAAMSDAANDSVDIFDTGNGGNRSALASVEARDP